MLSRRPLTVSAAFWLISAEAGWAWAADGWVICCCWRDTDGWPEAGLLGEGWAAGCGAWPACLRRAGRWGGAGLDGVWAACWEVALTTEGGVVCCWTIGCACGWTSALVTGDTTAAAAVSAPAAAAGYRTKIYDRLCCHSKGYICKNLKQLSAPGPKSNCESFVKIVYCWYKWFQCNLYLLLWSRCLTWIVLWLDEWQNWSLGLLWLQSCSWLREV